MSFGIVDPKGAVQDSRRGRCALAIMAKAPRPGRVKTRLSPPLSVVEAAELSVRLLRDTAENVLGVAERSGARCFVSYTPAGGEALFDDVLPRGYELLLQRGEDFGQRLLHTAEDLMECGFESVCLIDSDSPSVPQEAYEQAVRELAREGDRVVLGPAADGGYYLIGLKQAHPEFFEGVRWSTPQVYADTLERAERARLEVVELPLWYDVDDAASLDMLRAELLAGMAPGFALTAGYEAPHTTKFLAGLDPAVTVVKGLAVDAGGAADAAVDYRETPVASGKHEGA